MIRYETYEDENENKKTCEKTVIKFWRNMKMYMIMKATCEKVMNQSEKRHDDDNDNENNMWENIDKIMKINDDKNDNEKNMKENRDKIMKKWWWKW